MLGLPAPFVPHSASLSPTTATRVLSTRVPVSAPPTGLDVCLFSISLVSVPLAVRFSVSSGCARRRSVSTYAAILVPLQLSLFLKFYLFNFGEKGREGEREGEKDRCVRDKLISCLSHTPNQGTGLQPRHVL